MHGPARCNRDPPTPHKAIANDDEDKPDFGNLNPRAQAACSLSPAQAGLCSSASSVTIDRPQGRTRYRLVAAATPPLSAPCVHGRTGQARIRRERITSSCGRARNPHQHIPPSALARHCHSGCPIISSKILFSRPRNTAPVIARDARHTQPCIERDSRYLASASTPASHPCAAPSVSAGPPSALRFR